MCGRHIREHALVGFITAVAVVAGVTYGALALAGVDFGGSGAAEPSQADANSIKYLSNSRDRLAICAQAVGDDAAIQAAAKIAVEGALPTLAKNPIWVKYGFSTPIPQVDEGCPSPPALYDTSLNPGEITSLFEVRGRKVTQPSYYRVHVFVIPTEAIDRLTTFSTARRTAEELVCEGDTCDEVTTGLYISADELDDTTVLVNLLENAIGLR